MALSNGEEEVLYNNMDVYANDREELVSTADELLIFTEIFLEKANKLKYTTEVASALEFVKQARKGL
jgi:hypothetical protein